METISIDTWSEFGQAIAKIRLEFGHRTLNTSKGLFLTENDILFRGQSNANWQLETTLDRASDEPITLTGYYERAEFVVKEIESVTGRDWSIPSFPKIRGQISEVRQHIDVGLPYCEYLVYLRHHGFPSPLLDWTSSPFVAAFFAFEKDCDADKCAIFAFIERPTGGKSLWGGNGIIRTVGRHMKTHNRHFKQKSNYTFATTWNDELKSASFCAHDSVKPDLHNEQDILIKITIPRSERIHALRQLEEFNINYYTLFGTEDSLIRTLGMRAFDLDE